MLPCFTICFVRFLDLSNGDSWGVLMFCLIFELIFIRITESICLNDLPRSFASKRWSDFDLESSVLEVWAESKRNNNLEFPQTPSNTPRRFPPRSNARARPTQPQLLLCQLTSCVFAACWRLLAVWIICTTKLCTKCGMDSRFPDARSCKLGSEDSCFHFLPGTVCTFLDD